MSRIFAERQIGSGAACGVFRHALSLDSHLNAEVGEADRRRTDLEDSPMSPSSAERGQEPRGGWRRERPALGGLDSHLWTEVRAANRRSNDLEDSPMSRISAERGNWLAALDDFRNWLIREAA